jgi:hypothetical protein
MSQSDEGSKPEALAELDGLKSKARSRQRGCYWHARRYLLSYRRWERRAVVVSVVGGLASVLAGATLLTDAAKDTREVAVAIGVLGVLAGVSQALERAVGPQKRADDYRKGEVAYDQMRARYKLFVDTWTDPASAVGEYRTLRGQDEALPAQLPRPVEGWTHAAVERERGQAQRSAAS